jgi:hypothetical protein
MAVQLPPASTAPVARQAREQFVAYLEGVLPALSDAIRMKLVEMLDGGASGRDAQERRDALHAFEQYRPQWVQGTARAWRNAVVPPTATARIRLGAINLELIGDDVVENKILSSRLALAVRDKASWELNDLKARIQHLENVEDLASQDILQPEAISQLLIEQWTASELQRESWIFVRDVLQQHMVERMLEAYRQTNQFLIANGVLPEIDLTKRVKRGASTPPRKGAGAAGESTGFGADANVGAAPYGRSDYGRATQGYGGEAGPGSPGGAGGAQGNGGEAGATRGGGNVNEETRMMTSGTPLARARQRANGILGQLRRLLTDRVAGFDINHVTRPSPALDEALSIQQTAIQATMSGIATGGAVATAGDRDEIVVYDEARVGQVAAELRQRSGELKKKAATSSEKATIEIVALMFQSILAEERIPPAIRVWFARLQMPVLRVAIAEPEFFGSLSHPARQLIDRMGSCVMGFDASTIGGSALETEVKRVVQVIEQYPETGRRVFQLVYDEFQKFLSRFLTEKGPTQRLVSVAQQVEQKETMAIQYTIEMRRMLNDMPVRDEIREFLFKIWAEVLAVAAVKNGPQHEQTLSLKKSASDLVWAASAKPNRNDRARVIADLPALLVKLRQGMELLGIQGHEQEAQLKLIGDTLADAFLSKTEAIPQARIDDMAQRLANLEDFVGDDPNTDLPLDAESIEMMLGIDASMIEVLADGGSRPTMAMLAWAQELQLGNWFTLDHNSQIAQVQYVWRSERKQLHLFASSEGRSYLLQARRMASYLQAGLLLPNEEEALTVRATRDALAKLDANPERLLG